MIKHDAEWYKQRAIEKKKHDRANRNFWKNRAACDMEELEKLYSQILDNTKLPRKL